jgi:hypothetical protein
MRSGLLWRANEGSQASATSSQEEGSLVYKLFHDIPTFSLYRFTATFQHHGCNWLRLFL